MLSYFKGSYIFAFFGFLIAYFWTHKMHPGLELSALFIVLVLSVLEVSLSFDNAVINATKLEKMSKIWQKRFLTWGIWVAVFGMRFLFPILIVAIFSNLDILSVVNLAFNEPDKYSNYLHQSHPMIITFGASFLVMLFFTYFLNHQKQVHWISFLEKPFSKLGHIKGLNVVLTLSLLMIFQAFVNPSIRYSVFISGIWGIIVYLLIEGISSALENNANEKAKENCDCSPKFNMTNHCFINFLYLELIDASFSLDGVLGAFALSKDILIITIGLSIGAMFVRSLTVMLTEKKTLKEYIYLEHGAHYAIGALAIIMFISSFREVSEVITGFLGLFFIICAFFTSVIKSNRDKKQNLQEKIENLEKNKEEN